jgi:hypothetical protein
MTYYLELHDAINVHRTSHFLPTMVKLVVFGYYKTLVSLLDKINTFNSKKI